MVSEDKLDKMLKPINRQLKFIKEDKRQTLESKSEYIVKK